MRVGIAGITGRLGQLLVQEARAAGDQVVGGTSRAATGPGDAIIAGFSDIARFSDIASLAAICDVVIDFTHASRAAFHAAALAQAGVPLVLGTSGLSADDEAAVAAAAADIPICYAPNFAPGVTLALVLAERMAAALPASQYDAEILEMHHRQKVDAPSGTAIGLGRAVAAGRGVDFAAMMDSGRDGHTGPRKTGAIGFAALRGGQVVGEHSLIFAGASEHLVLTHRSFDRRVYATGAVQAAHWLVGRAPGLFDMRDVLGLAPTPP